MNEAISPRRAQGLYQHIESTWVRQRIEALRAAVDLHNEAKAVVVRWEKEGKL